MANKFVTGEEITKRENELTARLVHAMLKENAARYEYLAELLYFFPPPPSQPKPEETPVPKRITEKCPKCGMYFQYQVGDKVIHKACKK